MKTVKQVAELSGVSIRALHYYDKIGLLKPSKISEAGYRLYDEKALETLQQILFFKELEVPLKDVKVILTNPQYNKKKTLQEHKKLLLIKRDRLNNLIKLLERTLEGVDTVSFKEFDLGEYYDALEVFCKEHEDEVIKSWGSVEQFNTFISNIKDKESKVAQVAIQQYGSIERYIEAMKYNLSHYSENVEHLNNIQKNMEDYQEKSDEITKRLLAMKDLKPSCKEVQKVVQEMITMAEANFGNMDMGEYYWDMVADGYLSEAKLIEVMDQKFGEGSSNFIGTCIKEHLRMQREKPDEG